MMKIFTSPFVGRRLILLLSFFSIPHLTALGQTGACSIDHDHAVDEQDRLPFFMRLSAAQRADGPAELPLKGSRSIKINTQEGTWLSLDLSPDGKKLVFAMLGDLYEIPVSGGKARQLTSGIAFDSQPKYSPDGKSIAFISDRDGAENVHIFSTLNNQVEKQLTKSRDEYYQGLEWSPDGNYIVVAKGVGTPKLNLIHIKGGNGIILTPTPEDGKAIEPVFSPDGSKIWFSKRKGMWDYNAQLPQYQIVMLDRKTGEIETKVSRQGSAFAPTPSPDGKWLVYGTRYNTETALVLQNIQTGEEKWLAYPVAHDDQESLASMGVLPNMAFSPDSKLLYAAYGGKIYAIAIDGSGAKEISFQVDTEIMIGPKLEFKYPITDEKTLNASQIRDAALSPDGKKLVFTVFDKLYLMDYPNGKPKRLTSMTVTEAQPVWSPDGKELAFITWDDTEGAIYKVAASAGAKPKKLTQKKAIFQEPVWSPDGEKIVFVQGQAIGYQLGTNNRAAARQSISWIGKDGGESHFIAKAIGSKPHFSNNDDLIYLFNATEGLISIDWSGNNKKSRMKSTGIATYDFSNTNGGQFSYFRRTASPSRIIKSPKGDKAFAQFANEIYVITVPEAAGETPVISIADVSKSAFPSWKITEIGAEFPEWSADGKQIHWSLGTSFFSYNVGGLDSAKNTASEHKITVSIARDIPAGEILLQNARIITMKGDQVIEKGDILIRNNRIAEIGASGTLTAAASAKKLDLSGKTITPGFFDLHAHLGGAAGIHVAQPVAYLAQLAYGVTTIRDPQPGTTDILTYGDLVDAGKMLAPRLYSTGPGVAFWAYNLKSLDHTRSVLKQYSEYFNTKTIKMYAVGNRQQRQWIIMAAKEQQLMPTTEGNLDMKLNLTEVLDGYPGHEHGYPMFPWYKDYTEFVAKSGIGFSSAFMLGYGGPNGETYYYTKENIIHDQKLDHFQTKDDIDRRGRRRNAWFADEEYVFERQSKIVKNVLDAGGLPTIGAHGQLQGLGYHWELWLNKSGGMSSLEVLRLATINGAKAIGLDGDLGSLESGKLADLVIMDKNPLDDIRNTNTIKYVMKNGRLYEGNTLDQVLPEVKKLPAYNWQNRMPEGLPGVK